MRILSAVMLGVALSGSGQAMAGTDVSVRVEHYEISGDSGEALLRAMDRKGPKQGLLARAMAQTRYGLSWELDWNKDGSNCRLRAARAKLAITYRYPRAVDSGMDADLKKRWKRFMAEVRAHEEKHGKLAREMAAAAHRSVVGMSNADDPGCRKTYRQVQDEVDSISASYDKRQLLFDAIEHRAGGKVRRAVEGLLGKH